MNQNPVCGIKHKKDDGNYEFYDMKMTAENSPVQLPPRRTARCKFCKEVLILERKPTDEEKLKLDKSTLEDIFLKKVMSLHHLISHGYKLYDNDPTPHKEASKPAQTADGIHK